MQIVAQIIFLVALTAAILLFTRNIKRIRRNILLGKDLDRTDNKPQRWKTMMRVAFGQSKMGSRPVAAIMHLFIYVGFVLINPVTQAPYSMRQPSICANPQSS